MNSASTPKPMSLARDIAGLSAFLVVTALAAALGSVASITAREFYGALSRPAWSPPGAVFGPVWTVLYIMMAVAAWRVWRKAGFCAARVPLSLYAVQLVLNALWSWLFFAWRLGAWSLVEIIVLWTVLLATTVSFYRVHRLAGLLLVPYLAWVTFATALTAAVWRGNPGLL